MCGFDFLRPILCPTQVTLLGEFLTKKNQMVRPLPLSASVDNDLNWSTADNLEKCNGNNQDLRAWTSKNRLKGYP
jgi:hypothetical protein